MADKFINDSMLEVYVFETLQNIEQLENAVLESEKTGRYSAAAINEVFRIMHTIKGSSAMMMLDNLAELAHKMEDLFYYIRETQPKQVDYAALSDLVLSGIDFIQAELKKIQNKEPANGDVSDLLAAITAFLEHLKAANGDFKQEQNTLPAQPAAGGGQAAQPAGKLAAYEAVLYYEEGCEMENIRAYGVIHNLQEMVEDLYYRPADILENDETAAYIREHGFTVGVLTARPAEEMRRFFEDVLFLEKLEFRELDAATFTARKSGAATGRAQVKAATAEFGENEEKSGAQKAAAVATAGQGMISVNVAKLDKLMDLVGEMVIAEAMVVQNPDLAGLELENFRQAARQLHKITSEIQDLVMSVRMVPLANTFLKMQRIVRDMSKKLQKEVKLQLIDEDTEVDKNIIEHISDPLMHLIRNAVDHGLETAEERLAAGKDKTGTVVLEARNVGNHVLIMVRDDGRGLDKEKILRRAEKNNILTKPAEEMTEKEIFQLIFLPGFSTSEQITEYSGRGVGMDVVAKNLEKVGGSVSVDSVSGQGTTLTLKLPLTMAIIEGMNLTVGRARYTIPISAIKESVRLENHKLIKDTDGNEMLLVRGECYPIIRLHEFFKIPTEVTNLEDGIFILVDYEDKPFCLFVDDLLGQQEVVVKALPRYIQNKRIRGIGGCTLLGDGSISLILDVSGFVA
ncbi:MAG: chemotaxis protein CheA [Firmicutes bacterium]|nr:chemotaxis protein CheA [Bacillota bacterium]